MYYFFLPTKRRETQISHVKIHSPVVQVSRGCYENTSGLFVCFPPMSCWKTKCVSPSISASFLRSENCLHTKATGGSEVGWALPFLYLLIFLKFYIWALWSSTQRLQRKKVLLSQKTPETFQGLTTLPPAKTSPNIVLLTTLLPDALRYSCAFSASLS